MNNVELAKSNLRQAEERFKHAKEALEAGNYPYVIRQCQEAVELSLKAALRVTGVEPPKWHDVGPIL
ncbi:MAG: HEPN domain-containing protein, partial [Candidatus Bathyarchaeia archaeon]